MLLVSPVGIGTLGSAATIKNLVSTVEGKRTQSKTKVLRKWYAAKVFQMIQRCFSHWDLNIILFVSYKFMAVALCGNLNSQSIRFLFRCRCASIQPTGYPLVFVVAAVAFVFVDVVVVFFSLTRSGKHFWC